MLADVLAEGLRGGTTAKVQGLVRTRMLVREARRLILIVMGIDGCVARTRGSLMSTAVAGGMD